MLYFIILLDIIFSDDILVWKVCEALDFEIIIFALQSYQSFVDNFILMHLSQASKQTLLKIKKLALIFKT